MPGQVFSESGNMLLKVTYLQMAQFRERWDLLRWLAEKGVDINRKIVQVVNKEEGTVEFIQ
jgi:hypothetical protein